MTAVGRQRQLATHDGTAAISCIVAVGSTKLNATKEVLRVHPLLSDLDAWVATGYPVELNDPL